MYSIFITHKVILYNNNVVKLKKKEKMSLDAILKQYENNTQSKSQNKKRLTGDDLLKQYFTTYMPDGVNSTTKKIRILPVGENESPFVEMMGHKIQVGKQWRTFICPQHHNDEPCPFCEVRQGLLAEGDDESKELAKGFRARKMYAVKIIDRAHEDEGPKFWRFNHDFRKTGIFDKIFGVLQAIADSASPDITDINSGRDLIITVNRDMNNRPVVSSISQGDPSSLHTNEDVIKDWLSDEKVSVGYPNGVYKVKPYEYLHIVVKGGEPAWRKDESHEKGGYWYDKSKTETTNGGERVDDSEELTMGTPNTTTEVPTTKVESTTNTSTTTTSTEDDVDDLPF